jgi:hypothetical protein
MVSWDETAMELLRKHVMARFLAAEPVGEEVTGILYGVNEDGYRIAGWKAIDRQTAGAPAVPLTSIDERALRSLTEQMMDGAHAIGWFRSRTRGMAALSPEDLSACRKLFEDRECVALILRPSTQRPIIASFSITTAGEGTESSQRGVRVSLAARPATPEPAPEPPKPVAATATKTPVRRSLWKPLVAFAVGIAAATAATFLLVDRPVHLRVIGDDTRVIVEWNRSAGFLSRATSGRLRLGGQTIPLSQSQLRQGRWVGVAPAGDFAVSLHLNGGLMGPHWDGVTFVRQVPFTE